MAPGRKGDPGPRFDWRRLALQGLSVWPDEGGAPKDPAAFGPFARGFGYPDLDEGQLLAAFRLRFRPWQSGDMDATDRAMAHDLARRFPFGGVA